MITALAAIREPHPLLVWTEQAHTLIVCVRRRFIPLLGSSLPGTGGLLRLEMVLDWKVTKMYVFHEVIPFLKFTHIFEWQWSIHRGIQGAPCILSTCYLRVEKSHCCHRARKAAAVISPAVGTIFATMPIKRMHCGSVIPYPREGGPTTECGWFVRTELWIIYVRWISNMLINHKTKRS